LNTACTCSSCGKNTGHAHRGAAFIEPDMVKSSSLHTPTDAFVGHHRPETFFGSTGVNFKEKNNSSLVVHSAPLNRNHFQISKMEVLEFYL